MEEFTVPAARASSGDPRRRSSSLSAEPSSGSLDLSALGNSAGDLRNVLLRHKSLYFTGKLRNSKKKQRLQLGVHHIHWRQSISQYDVGICPALTVNAGHATSED